MCVREREREREKRKKEKEREKKWEQQTSFCDFSGILLIGVKEILHIMMLLPKDILK